MRWLLELLFAVFLAALAVYALTLLPKSPVAVTAGRQDIESAYNYLLQLSMDPSFLGALQSYICGYSTPQQVLNALNSIIPPTYIYNLTVSLVGSSPPPCLACAQYNETFSFARPWGWPGSASMASATVMAVLPDGAPVEITLYLARP